VSASRTDARAPSGLVWSALSVVYVVWGSTYLAIAFLVDSMPPLLSLGTRFVVAAGILAALVRWRQGPHALRVTGAEVRGAAVIGALLLAGGLGAVAIAELNGVPSGVAALLVAALPLWAAVLRRLGGDRPGAATIAGIAIGFAGLAILIAPEALSEGALGAPVPWMLLIVAGTMSWATGSWLSGRLSLPSDPFVLTVYEMLLGGLVLMAIGTIRGEWAGLDPDSWTNASLLAWLYLVLIGSVLAFTAFVWLVRSAPLSLVFTYAYVNPVIAVLLGSLLRDEPITAVLIVGGTITVVGVLLVVRGETR